MKLSLSTNPVAGTATDVVRHKSPQQISADHKDNTTVLGDYDLVVQFRIPNKWPIVGLPDVFYTIPVRPDQIQDTIDIPSVPRNSVESATVPFRMKWFNKTSNVAMTIEKTTYRRAATSRQRKDNEPFASFRPLDKRRAVSDIPPPEVQTIGNIDPLDSLGLRASHLPQ